MFRPLLAALFAACVLSACAPSQTPVPSNVSLGGGVQLPSPRPALNAAPPQILAMNFSGDDVRRGQTWSGTIVTSTNVASVEVRTNLFSINAPRRTFGDFAFAMRIYDVPPIFIRAYRVRVIARNSTGQSVEEDIPFRIR